MKNLHEQQFTIDFYTTIPPSTNLFSSSVKQDISDFSVLLNDYFKNIGSNLSIAEIYDSIKKLEDSVASDNPGLRIYFDRLKHAVVSNWIKNLTINQTIWRENDPKNLEKQQFLIDFYTTIPVSGNLFSDQAIQNISYLSDLLNLYFKEIGSNLSIADISKSIKQLEDSVVYNYIGLRFYFDSLKNTVLSSWAENIKTKPTPEEFKDYNQFELPSICNKLLINKNINFTLNDLFNTPYLNVLYTTARFHLEKNGTVNFVEFYEFIKNFAIKKDIKSATSDRENVNNILELITKFLKNKNCSISLNELNTLLSFCSDLMQESVHSAYFLEIDFINQIIEAWLDTHIKQTNFDDLKKSIQASYIPNIEKRIVSHINKRWLSGEDLKNIFGYGYLTLDALKPILKSTDLNSFEKGITILLYIENLIKTINLSVDQLIYCINLFDSSQAVMKQFCIDNYIKDNLDILSDQDIIKILKISPYINTIELLLEKYISNEEKQEAFLKLIINLPQATIGLDELKPFIELVQSLDFNNPTYLLNIANTVFPGAPYLKKSFYEQFDITDESIDSVRQILKSIGDDSLEFEYLEYLQANWTNQLKLLEVIDGRLDSKFLSLKNLFSNKTIGDAIKVAAKNDVIALFDNENVLTFPIASLFSYYHMKGEVEEFLSLLNDNYIKEIKTTFTLPTNTAFLTHNEFEIIKYLLEEQLQDLPTYNGLCEFVIKHKENINTKINIDQFNINFEAETAYTADIQLKMTSLIKEAVTENDVHIVEEKISEFINYILQAEQQSYSTNEINKITRVFATQKNELLHVLSSKGGITHIKQALYAAGDGCVANIGTVFKNSIDSFLIKNMGARILDTYMRYKMLPLLTSAISSDVLGARSEGADYLKLDVFASCRILPVGIVLELVAVEFKAGDYILNHAQIGNDTNLRRIITEPVFSNLFQREDIALASKSVAALLILKKALPENQFTVIKDRFLKHIKTNNVKYNHDVEEAIHQTLTIFDVRDFALKPIDLSNKENIDGLKDLAKNCKNHRIPKEDFLVLIEPLNKQLKEPTKANIVLKRRANDAIDSGYGIEIALNAQA